MAYFSSDSKYRLQIDHKKEKKEKKRSLSLLSGIGLALYVDGRRGRKY